MQTQAYVGRGKLARLWHRHGGLWHWVSDNHPTNEHDENDAQHPLWVLTNERTPCEPSRQNIERYQFDLLSFIGTNKRKNSNQDK